ncbi:MAG: glycosyltransferase family 4 protein [Acidimicrobiales bacterium]
MRILIAITKGEVGGAQEHVAILAQALLGRGHDVALLANEPSPLAGRMKDLGASIFPWNSIVGPPNLAADIKARRELRRAVAEWKPEIVHLNSSKAGALGVGILSPPNGVTVFTCHHLPFGPGRRWRNRIIARPVDQFLLPRMDGIISVGIRDMPLLQRIAPEVPLSHIPNAVPTPDPPVSTGAVRPRAIWVARMAHPKDPLLACRAWERVIEHLPDAHLTLCGEGPLEGRVRKWLTASQIGSSIDYPGFVPDLRPLQAQASIFLLASKVEGGLTMATLEAMAQGLVPVVTDAGDSVFLRDNECGVFVSEYSPKGIANAIRDLIADPDRYYRLRNNALEYTRRERVPNDLVEETLDFYRRVLEMSGVKRCRA